MAKWMLPFMFPDTIHHKFAMILISGFLADNRRLVALSRMSWLILAVRGFTPPRIKTVLSTNAWLSTCGSTWGLTISSICSLCTKVFAEVKSNLQFLLTHPISLLNIFAEADFTPSLKLEVDMLIIINRMAVWSYHYQWCKFELRLMHSNHALIHVKKHILKCNFNK